MRGPPASNATGPSQWTATLSPLAIVALVIIIGAAAYLWYMGYMRSRAALITLVGIVAVLIYLGFFAMQPPT
jgi:ABC-type siderophore export system fused ATPase/permease subunit